MSILCDGVSAGAAKECLGGTPIVADVPVRARTPSRRPRNATLPRVTGSFLPVLGDQSGDHLAVHAGERRQRPARSGRAPAAARCRLAARHGLAGLVNLQAAVASRVNIPEDQPRFAHRLPQALADLLERDFGRQDQMVVRIVPAHRHAPVERGSLDQRKRVQVRLLARSGAGHPPQRHDMPVQHPQVDEIALSHSPGGRQRLVDRKIGKVQPETEPRVGNRRIELVGECGRPLQDRGPGRRLHDRAFPEP